MKIGGAQKSLLSFLQCFAASEYRRDYAVDLLVLQPEGEFLSQIPGTVRLVQPGNVLRWMGSALKPDLILKHPSLRGMIGELGWIIRKKLRLFPKGLNTEQKLWACWHRLLPEQSGEYDVAVSYLDGVTNYYIMDKVRAAKKVLWYHSDYQKQGYAPWFDRRTLEDCSRIITISDTCRDCLLHEFPQLKDKIDMVENITSAEQLRRWSLQGECPEYDGAQGVKLLTVGRLHPQKGIDIAIEAARVLKKKGFAFRWLVAGDGAQRESLQQLIDRYQLNDQFILMGARSNPYAYMRGCDILVQPSRVEGKSIVLDEAKILCKPIVSTNYTTVGDAIEHGVTGWITEMNGEALAEGIIRMAQDHQLRAGLMTHLQSLPKGNDAELKRYIDFML